MRGREPGGGGGGRGQGPRRPGRDGRPWQGRARGDRDERTGHRRKFQDRERPRGPGGPRRPAFRRDDASPAESFQEPSASAPAPPGARLTEVEELEVRIEKLVAGGDGLARWEGIPIFIPRSAPGDLLLVRITERRPDYGRAEILEVLEPGPARRPDPYPELSPTGICDLQHIQDEIQPQLKAAAVRETLARLGGVTVPADAELITGEPWGYRLRTQVHTEIDPVGGGVRVGYYARGTKDLIPVEGCALLVPELDELLRELPAHLLQAGAPNRLDLAAGEGAVTVSPTVPGLPHGEVSLQVGDLSYFYDARSFFQGHRGLLPKLVQRVVGEWEGELAYDLYGGVGLFTLPLAQRYRKVVSVEGDTVSARFARMNARRNRLTNIEIVARVVETWIDALPEGIDRVVVDPPRGGLSPKVPRALMDRRPKRLTYVSCHPATLARDLRLLTTTYRIESIALIDLFPQTGHMEAIVQMALEPQV